MEDSSTDSSLLIEEADSEEELELEVDLDDAPRRFPCPYCGSAYTVTLAGNLRKHGNPVCLGSGLPVDAKPGSLASSSSGIHRPVQSLPSQSAWMSVEQLGSRLVPPELTWEWIMTSPIHTIKRNLADTLELFWVATL